MRYESSIQQGAEDMSETPSVIINSVDRAMDILLYIYNTGGEVSITSISQALGIYKSTVYRTLATLENKGFVEQNPDNGRYTLGMRLYTMGLSIGDKLGLQKLVKPYTRQLHEEFREAVNVSIIEKNPLDVYKSVIIWKEEGNQILRFNLEVGSRNDCHCAGVGKCLIAFGEDIDLSIYEERGVTVYTDKTIRTLDELKRELEKIRIQGYAVDDEEWEEGLTCVAAPILRRGVAVAAISVSGPTQRIRQASVPKIVQRLKAVCNEIAKSLV